MSYNILSPDGITIHREETYKTERIAWEFAKKWAKRYETQGYYSSAKFGRIPIEKILDYCTLVDENLKPL